jgi:hypothetical protein
MLSETVKIEEITLQIDNSRCQEQISNARTSVSSSVRFREQSWWPGSIRQEDPGQPALRVNQEDAYPDRIEFPAPAQRASSHSRQWNTLLVIFMHY